MTVTLTAEQEKFIADQLKSGNYCSADDVVAQSLGMLQAQEEFIRSNTAELREKIAAGMDDLRHGRVIDSKTAIENVRKKLRERQRGEG
jgi:antitoxin ParD1/3/4